jgi:DNA invertase Pin-like site-specific DNA recombinase
MVADLGALLLPPTHRNTIETEIQPPAQHQRRLRQDEVARLVEDYVSGVSVDDLVVAHGVNRTTVYAHLDRGGIERPRGVGKLSAGQVRHAAELYENGDPAPAIALKFGVSEETVRRALRPLGVQLRRG